MMRNPQLPGETAIALLKKELNFLLWTGEPARIEGFQSLVAAEQVQQGTANIQCVAHTVITGALFARLGFQVTVRGGGAYITNPAPRGNCREDYLHEIGNHYWITVDDRGLIDLSLSPENMSHSGEVDPPPIYCNRSIGGEWQVEFTDDRAQLQRFLRARKKSCLYLTVNKKRLDPSVLAQDLGQPFKPSVQAGFPLRYADFLIHCEQLLRTGESLITGQSQRDAWAALIARSSLPHR